MKRIIVASSLLAMSACAVTVRNPVHDVDGYYDAEEVYYTQPAPIPRAEVVIGVAPSRNHVWVPGYWTRHRDNWYWMQGRWAPRPSPRSTWVPGQWDHRGNRYVRTRGHWR